MHAALHMEVRRAGREDALALSTDYGDLCHFDHLRNLFHTDQRMNPQCIDALFYIMLTFRVCVRGGAQRVAQGLSGCGLQHRLP